MIRINNLRKGEEIVRLSGGRPCEVWTIEWDEVLLHDALIGKSFWVSNVTLADEWMYPGSVK